MSIAQAQAQALAHKYAYLANLYRLLQKARDPSQEDIKNTCIWI